MIKHVLIAAGLTLAIVGGARAQQCVEYGDCTGVNQRYRMEQQLRDQQQQLDRLRQEETSRAQELQREQAAQDWRRTMESNERGLEGWTRPY